MFYDTQDKKMRYNQILKHHSTRDDDYRKDGQKNE